METPLLVFVNTKSGGLQGARIIEKLKKCTPPETVFDLAQGGPLPGLQKYIGQKYRIVVCGGDGSVGWVLTEIEKLKLSRELTPPVAILPIGTGNDLSRVLKWGGSHKGTKLQSFLAKIEKACLVLMDKWQISYTGDDLPHAQHCMNNYFSLGADAHIALQFHEARLAHPEKFSSRTQNLAWYVRLGMQNMSPEIISPHVTVEINGERVELPEQTKCLVVLNLPSYSGGGNPWGTKKSTRRKFSNPAIDDGLLEVVAVNGPLQLVGIHANIVRGKRLGQGNNVKITTTKPLAAQVDGEPWKQPPSVISVSFAGKSHMLANSSAGTLTSSDSSSVLALPNGSSSSSLLSREEPIMNRTLTARTLVRSRSSSVPIVHTQSPIAYGPVLPSKRRKGRLYCDACGLEFYLPYMLDNHHSSGLCSNAASSSSSSSGVAKPEIPSPKRAEDVADGASSSAKEEAAWRSKSAEVSRREKPDERESEDKEPWTPREQNKEPVSSEGEPKEGAEVKEAEAEEPKVKEPTAEEAKAEETKAEEAKVEEPKAEANSKQNNEDPSPPVAEHEQEQESKKNETESDNLDQKDATRADPISSVEEPQTTTSTEDSQQGESADQS